MYIKIGEKFADGDFNFLERFLEIIDTEIKRIHANIRVSKCPVSDGYLDYLEYMLGFGFVAIQKYLTSTYTQISIEKNNALDINPKTIKNLALMKALNAGGNYWKHQDEWFFIDPNSCKENKSMSYTISTIEEITPVHEYTLYSLLHEILILTDITPVEGALFSPLLPQIKKWRAEIDKHCAIKCE